MKATIQTLAGKVTLKVFYDPALCNWDEAAAAGLASFGLKQGQAAVLALPFPYSRRAVLSFTGKKQKPVGIGLIEKQYCGERKPYTGENFMNP